MVQTQVLRGLLDLEAAVGPRTLKNYVAWGLVPEPKVNYGRGNLTEYAPETVAEAFASWKLMHEDVKLSPEKVSEVRGIALHLENGNYFSISDLKADNQLKTLTKGKELETFLALRWLKDRNRVLYDENESLFEEIKKVQQERDMAAREGREQEAGAANDRLIELADERNRRKFLNKLTAGALLAVTEDYLDYEWTPDA